MVLNWPRPTRSNQVLILGAVDKIALWKIFFIRSTKTNPYLSWIRDFQIHKLVLVFKFGLCQQLQIDPHQNLKVGSCYARPQHDHSIAKEGRHWVNHNTLLCALPSTRGRRYPTSKPTTSVLKKSTPATLILTAPAANTTATWLSRLSVTEPKLSAKSAPPAAAPEQTASGW